MSQTTEDQRPDVPALTLGWRLKMALSHGDVSRGEMAEVLNVDPATITRWTGDVGAPPRALYLREIAIRCGVPFAWLTTGDGTTWRYPENFLPLGGSSARRHRERRLHHEFATASSPTDESYARVSHLTVVRGIAPDAPEPGYSECVHHLRVIE